MYSSPRFFARSYFGGVWPSLVGINILPAGIYQQVLFGQPELRIELKIQPAGIGQVIGFGTPTIQLDISPAGILQSTVFGTAITQLAILPAGISQETLVGTPITQLDIRPVGISQSTLFGTPTIQRVILPTGILQDIQVGTPEITIEEFLKVIRPTGIGQGVLFGQPTIFVEIAFEELIDIYAKLKAVEPSILTRTRPTVRPIQPKMVAAVVNTYIKTEPTEPAITAKAQIDKVAAITDIITIGTLDIPINRLDHLADVDPAGEVSGATVVYSEDTDTYEVKKLDYDELGGGKLPPDVEVIIEGGDF